MAFLVWDHHVRCRHVDRWIIAIAGYGAGEEAIKGRGNVAPDIIAAMQFVLATGGIRYILRSTPEGKYDDEVRETKRFSAE